MKAGVRALGVAESYRAETSTLAGAVVRADRVVDGFSFGTCTVGGSDATAAVLALLDRLDRADIAYLFVAGVAPAWFNLIDVRTVATRTETPVISVSFEASPGLEDAIREAFDGPAARNRLERYRDLPPRSRLTVNGETVFVRAAGLEGERAGDVVAAFTPVGGRPEPLRVARSAARAADAARRRWLDDE